MAVNPNLAELSQADRGKLESWLVRFDQSWKEGSVAEWVGRLEELPASVRPAALAEMVKIDLEQQWQHGRQVSLESYLQRLPELGNPETVSVELIHAEYEARREAGAPARLADFARRFPRQESSLRELVGRLGPKRTQARVPTGRPKAQATQETSRADPSTQSPAASRKPGRDLPDEFGRYRILKKLGEGGMGAVYLAHDTRLGRHVALKIPRFSADDGPQVMERFLREARSAATLHHPNVCPVHDAGEIDGVHYMTMAYIEGHTLSVFIRPGKPLPERQVAAVVRKLALALQEAHEHGIIHRDLKPSNIMIDRRHEPVIMDFGLARCAEGPQSHRTQTGTLLGTPAYMSPEQVLGQPDQIGPQADVYGLGVILYELLAGCVPFEGPPAAVIGQILVAEPPSPQEFRSDLDPTLVAICRKAMAKKREDRYPSMKEFAAALGEYLRAAKPSPAAPPPLPAEPTRPAHEQASLADIFADLAATADRSGGRKRTGRKIPARRRNGFPLAARHRNLAIGLATAAVFLLVAWAVVVRIRTPQGTLVIEVSEPGAQVEILDPNGVVEITRHAETGPLTITVDRGRHRLRVKKDGFELYVTDFTMVSGGEEVIAATLVPLETEPDRGMAEDQAEVPAPEATGETAGDTCRPWPTGPVRIVVATDSDWYGLALSDDVELVEVLEPPSYVEGERSGYQVGVYGPEDPYTHGDPRRYSFTDT